MLSFLLACVILTQACSDDEMNCCNCPNTANNCPKTPNKCILPAFTIGISYYELQPEILADMMYVDLLSRLYYNYEFIESERSIHA